jgi:DNA mismatch endonuclease (patch repair protein)
MDTISAKRRSANMRAIRSADMKPEMMVRRLTFSLGYRYRLHRKSLPGKPDLVFGPRRKVIFVHGCFWHQHPICIDGRMPKSNTVYWDKKLARNIERDAENLAALEAAGWKSLVIWECQTKDQKKLAAKIKRFLGR